MAEATALERVDAMAALVVERVRPATLRAAVSRDEVETAQRLRGTALLERGWATEADLDDGREVDADDERATHILAWRDDVAIATCRLVYPAPGRRLPMERRKGGVTVPGRAVEVGRVVVARGAGARERSISAALIGKAWLEIRAHGESRICGTVSASVLRLYRLLGFLVTVIGPPVTLLGEERFPILFEPTETAAAMAAARLSTAMRPKD